MTKTQTPTPEVPSDWITQPEPTRDSTSDSHDLQVQVSISGKDGS